MRLNSSEIICGQPILKIRSIMREAMNGRLRSQDREDVVKSVARTLMIPDAKAENVIEELMDNGYLALNKVDHAGDLIYELEATEKGRMLGVATANPAISRQKADELLIELIEKAKLVNATKELVYYVESIKVFGSYLSDKVVLGDLDVAVKITPKYVGAKFVEENQIRINQGKENGRNFSSFIDELIWPHKEVFMMLKTRKKGLSLHNEDEDDVVKVTETKTVYEFAF